MINHLHFAHHTLQCCLRHTLQITLGSSAAESRQSCPTLCDPIDGSPPGSAVPGILQARTPEWVAISFSSLKILFPDGVQCVCVCGVWCVCGVCVGCVCVCVCVCCVCVWYMCVYSSRITKIYSGIVLSHKKEMQVLPC